MITQGQRYIDADTTVFSDCVDLLIRAMDACIEVHRSLNFPGLAKEHHTYTTGPKYTKVWVAVDGVPQRIAFFIQNDNGDIWKAAGIAKPALNFTRGNIMTRKGRAVVTVGKMHPETGYFYSGF